ncbi:DUF397 domain-containing protein [Streptomyces sp. CC53]|uniref:DUF397 domain-containing protein n=1 Tax=Streptomyces sp. CC53 TaxID=1906740 RepID=UPI0009A0BBC1|nr:DUF397 domain-containing protein [Streptomyces sp. CC53]
MTDHSIPDSSALQGWRKSSYSGPEGGSCVEVLDGYPSGVPVRDSKTPHAPALVLSAGEWARFISAVKANSLLR